MVSTTRSGSTTSRNSPANGISILSGPCSITALHLAARPGVHLEPLEWDRGAVFTEPRREPLRFRPRLEDQLARRVEDPDDHDPLGVARR